MASERIRGERIEALRELMDRLCSADLTMAEAKSLRARLADLLDSPGADGGEVGPEGSPVAFTRDRTGEGRPRAA